MDPSTLTVAAARDHGCDQHGYGEDDGRPYDHEMALGWIVLFLAVACFGLVVLLAWAGVEWLL